MRVVFIGTGEIGVPTLRALFNSSEHDLVGVVTGPDKPVDRKQRIEPSPIKAALLFTDRAAKPPQNLTALSRQVFRCRSGDERPILQPARIKDRQSIEDIRGLTPDVIVVMAYGQILPGDILEIPKLACLNLHASLLPRWRGAAPIQAAIASGDQETGITVIYMDEGLDTGDILLQRKIDILPGDTGGSLHDRLAQIAPEACLESLRLFAAGKAPRIPQDNALSTYASKLNREDGRIDWSESAEVIERKIRAYNPWPGAFMKLDGRNLKIFSATVVDLAGRAGEILRKTDELIVAAGERALMLSEVQLEGKRRMNAAEFLRGERWIDRSADDGLAASS